MSGGQALQPQHGAAPIFFLRTHYFTDRARKGEYAGSEAPHKCPRIQCSPLRLKRVDQPHVLLVAHVVVLIGSSLIFISRVGILGARADMSDVSLPTENRYQCETSSDQCQTPMSSHHCIQHPGKEERQPGTSQEKPGCRQRV